MRIKLNRTLTGLFLCCTLVGQSKAAPVFQLGVDNNLGFQSVVNKTGGSTIAVGDIFYGAINLQDISSGTTSWNANNVGAPLDSFTGYFVTRANSVTATVTSLGTFYSIQFGVATSDPNGVLTSSELAAGAMMKLFTDTSTAYTSGGPVATDISNAIDGTHWATLGFNSSGGYWTGAVSPAGFAASGSSWGGLNFISNNTGLAWNKVIDTNCETAGGCPVDMKFVSTFSATAGGAWQVNFNDPAVMHPVPLPAALWLLGSGLLGLGIPFRRKTVF